MTEQEKTRYNTSLRVGDLIYDTFENSYCIITKVLQQDLYCEFLDIKDNSQNGDWIGRLQTRGYINYGNAAEFLKAICTDKNI